MWTRYFNVATEDAKEAFMTNGEVNMINNKPNGCYLAQNDAWMQWCQRRTNWATSYSHKKTLLNAADFRIFALSENNLPDYLVEIHKGLPFVGIDWARITREGYDGAHVPQSMINRSLQIYLDHGVQIGVYDVESLIIWSKKRKVWSEAVPNIFKSFR